MNRIKELLRRLAFFGRRDRFERDLDDEMKFHIECRADEIERTGISRREAIAQARREFGSGSRLAEDARSAWQIRWIEDLFSDLGYAARAFRRSPVFALTAVISLALGIGVNTTIFSLTTEFLFSRPSARDPESLVAIRVGGNSHASLQDYRFYRDAQVFDGFAGYREEGETNWRAGELSVKLYAWRVTDNYFDVIGVPLAMGRPIRSGDDYTVVISDRFWRSRLGADPEVLQRSLILDGRPHAVLGVLTADHRTLLGFGLSPDLYLPASAQTLVALHARLPQGMKREGASAPLRALASRLDEIHPLPYMKRSRDTQVTPVSGWSRLRKQGELMPVAAFFGLLMVVVGLVLLIACANVAGLLLARAATRVHELAVRLSIGAGRLRLVRQLLAESLLLAVLGTCGGLALNVWLTRLMSKLDLPLPVPVRLLIEPDWRLLTYAAAIAISSALLCGLAPAIKATRTDANAALKRQERQVAGGAWTLRGALVAGQLAVSVVLLATAFLFLRNLGRSTSMSPGFDVDRTVWASMALVPEQYAEPAKIAAQAEAVLESVRAVPGVESASIAWIIPFNDNATRGGEVEVSGSKEKRHISVYYTRVGPDYFRTMGIPLIGGREFLPADRKGAPAAVIINETFARRVFGAVNPVGQTFRFQGAPQTIVAVARDSKYFTLGEDPRPALYDAYFQQESRKAVLNIVARSSSPDHVLRSIESACLKQDASAAVEVKAMRNAMGLALLPSQAGALLLGSAGLLAVFLASIGLYGMLAYAVTGRTREIGLRVALGAERGAILRLVLGQSLALVGAGATIGIGIAIFAMKPLAMFLVPGLSPTDPVAFISVIAVLGAVALLATIAPARRALRVDPMTALRYE